MFEYYFFDLDGTLTDPAEGITNSFIHAIKYFGLEVPSYEKLCTFIGPPLVATFQNEFGFDDESEGISYLEYREKWIADGFHWFRENEEPTNWDRQLMEKQLSNAKLSKAKSRYVANR